MSKKNYLLIGFILLCTIQLFGQNRTPTIVNENTPQNNYKQTNVSIYPDSANGFLVTWEDHRYGTPLYYAQHYDENSQKVDEKFEIRDYYLISYASDKNSFGLFRESYSYSWPDGWSASGVTYYGELFNKAEIMSDSVYLGGGEYPWCGTGWPGEGNSISRYDDEILTATDFGGSYQLKKIYNSGNDSLLIPKYQDDDNYGYSVSTEYNKNRESILAYYGTVNYDSAGVYVQTFTKDNELITKKRIKSLQEDQANWGMRLNLKTIAVSDTLFQLLFIDSLKLRSIITNVHGNIITENECQIFYQNEYPESFFYDQDKITVSNFSDSSRAIIITIDEYENKHSSSIYYFDQHGELIGEPIFDSTFSHKLGAEVFKNENNELLFPAIVNDRAYLMKYNNFTFVDSTIISNDYVNSNEVNPKITKYKEDQFFVSYRNEVKTTGRFLSKDGNPISEEKEIDSQSLQFFSDGSAIKIWAKKEADYKMTRGFSILDSEFNDVKTDTLVHNYDNYYGFCSATISPNDESILVYQNISGVFAAKYDKYGIEIKTVKLSENNRGSVGARVFFDGSTIFVSWHNHIYIFDEGFEIESISDKAIYSIFAYLGDEEFAGSLYDYQEKRSAYSVFSSNGDTLLADITTIYRDINDPMVIGHAKDDEFIIFYFEEDQLLASTFNSLGENIIESFLVHKLDNEVVKDITFSVNADKIMFSWSGKSIGENDFDIYCISYDLDLLTDVKKNKNNNAPTEFSLSQNYPNPFNPSTKIEYRIPHPSADGVKSETVNVKLIVYDVLGREVATLVNKEQKPGTHEATFDASNLSSGVYYYQLKTSSFIQTNKMILVKASTCN